MLDRGVLGARVVLGDPDQGCRQGKTHDTGTKQTHLAACLGNGVVRHEPDCHKVKRDQRQQACNREPFVERWHDIFHARRGLDEHAANDRGDDGNGSQAQRIHHRLKWGRGHQQRTQHHGGNQRDRIGFKQVGCHACAVSDVVTHVVGDHGRVARIILWYTCLDLADQVSSHVRTLGENPAPEPGKDGNEGGAKGKSDHGIEGFGQFGASGCASHQKPIKARHTQQAQADHQHTRDGTTTECHIQCRPDALGRSLRRSHIGANRNVHTDKATCTGQDGANDEADGGFDIDEQPNQNRQDDSDNRDGFVLPGEVGCSPRLNRGCNFLHPRITGILGQNPASCPDTKQNCNQTTG